MKRFNGISALNKRNIEFGRLGWTFWLPNFGVAARSEQCHSFFPQGACWFGFKAEQEKGDSQIVEALFNVGKWQTEQDLHAMFKTVNPSKAWASFVPALSRQGWHRNEMQNHQPHIVPLVTRLTFESIRVDLANGLSWCWKPVLSLCCC